MTAARTSQGPVALSGTAQATYQKMMVAFEDRNNENALKFANSILVNYPDHGETLSIKGLVLGKNVEQHDEALATLKLAIRSDPDSVLCWHAIGTFHKDNRNFKEAISALKFARAKSIKQKDTNHGGNVSGILRDIMNIQMQMKDIPGALVMLNERMTEYTMASRDLVNWLTLSVLKHMNGEFDSAQNVLLGAWKSNIFANLFASQKNEIFMFLAMNGTRLFISNPTKEHPSLTALKIGKNVIIDKRNAALFEFVAHVQLNDLQQARQVAKLKLLKAEPQNLDFLLLYLYSSPDESVRNLFGNPLSRYVGSDAESRLSNKIQLPGAWDYTSDASWRRVQHQQEEACLFEPFRICVDSLYHLKDSFWLKPRCYKLHESLSLLEKTPHHTDAVEMTKWLRLMDSAAEPCNKQSVEQIIKDLSELDEAFSKGPEKDQKMNQVIVNYLRLFFSGDGFTALMAEFIRSSVLKGKGAVIQTILVWLCGRKNEMEVILFDLLMTEFRELDKKIVSNVTAMASYLTLVANVKAAYGAWNEANLLVDEAIVLTAGMDRESLMCKAMIQRRCLEFTSAYQWTKQAARLDTSDKNINTSLVMAAHAIDDNDSALEHVNIYSASGSPRDFLNVQSSWSLHHFAKSALRQGHYSDFLELTRRIRDMYIEGHYDQFDFHIYGMRQANLNAYIQFMHLQSFYFQQRDYSFAAHGAAMVYLQLSDDEGLLTAEKCRITDSPIVEYKLPLTTPDGVPMPTQKEYDTRGHSLVEGKDSTALFREADRIAGHMVSHCPISPDCWHLEFELGRLGGNIERVDKSLCRLFDLCKGDFTQSCLFLMITVRKLMPEPPENDHQLFSMTKEDLVGIAKELAETATSLDIAVMSILAMWLLTGEPISDLEAVLATITSRCTMMALSRFLTVNTKTRLQFWFRPSKPAIIGTVLPSEDKWIQEFFQPVETILQTKFVELQSKLIIGKKYEDIALDNSYLRDAGKLKQQG
eukprot:GHVH01000134.1.p1 GENE.GHVH01000134.1~~GHVH01000134.1.p1  ORF type:complete len:983 (+),score=156.61 GHVH01000134.1:47-2995(+)